MTAATFSEMIYELGGFAILVILVAFAMIASSVVERIHMRFKRRRKS